MNTSAAQTDTLNRNLRLSTLSLEDAGFNYLSDEERTAVISSFIHLRTKTPSILIVDDDVELSWLLETTLRKKMPNADITVANDPYEGLNMVLERDFNLIVLDWNLQGLSGREMLSKADHEFTLDPLMPDDRFYKKSKVVVLSVDPQKKCKIGRMDHFKHVGHISKMQRLDDLVDSIKSHYVGN